MECSFSCWLWLLVQWMSFTVIYFKFSLLVSYRYDNNTSYLYRALFFHITFKHVLLYPFNNHTKCTFESFLQNHSIKSEETGYSNICYPACEGSFVTSDKIRILTSLSCINLFYCFSTKLPINKKEKKNPFQ